VDVALEAMGEVARHNESILLLVGGKALQAFVQGQRGAIPAYARIVPPREDVADLFAAADVFLSASRHEGFSYAIGEALANGLPSVVSDIPAVRWAREGGVIFFPPDDVRAMARRIEEVLRWTPERRTAASSRAREFAASQLSLERWAARIAAVYRLACRRARTVSGGGVVALGHQGPG
jgi:glycosyltransferase involved in cell wall biosynthesis